MAFTLSAAKTISGVTNSYEVTGDGNLDDLATACAGIGMSRSYQAITFNPGASRILAVSGTLTEDRVGVRTVTTIGGGHICWAYASGSTTTLGKKDTTANAYTGRVDLLYQAGAYTSTGGDHFDDADPGKCFVGAGTFNGVCGSTIYGQTARIDLDVSNLVTLFSVDNWLFSFPDNNNSSGYSHMVKVASKFQTTANTSFVFSERPMEAGATVTEVSEFYTSYGIRWILATAGTSIRWIRPKVSTMDGYQCSATSEEIAVDPVSTYMGYDLNDAVQYQLAAGIKKILRTLRFTVTDAIGTDISTIGPQPKLVVLLPAGTTTVVNFSSKVANYEALQSTRASGADHSAAGLGWTAAGSYSAYVVGYGYEEQWLPIDPVTAHAGNAGIVREAALPKNPLAVTTYASVVTAGFSLDTGTNTLTITAALTSNQAAEYLLKLAYDNADAAYWRTLLHSPVSVNGAFIDFGALNIVVGTGGTLSGTPVMTSGTVTLTGSGAFGQALVVQDSTGTSVPIVVSGPRNGSKVRVVRADTEAELAIGNAGASGFFGRVTWTSDLPIRADVVYVSGIDAEQEVSGSGELTNLGASITIVQQPCAIYEGNAVDGSTITGLTIDVPNLEIDADEVDNSLTVQEFYAWYKYTLMSDDGIRNIFNAVQAVNGRKYVIKTAMVDLHFDNVDTVNTLVISGGVIQRDDGGAIRVPGSGSIEMLPDDVYISAQADANLTAIKNIVEADEVHSATTIQKRLRGTSTVLLEKGWTGTPLLNFQALDP